MSDCNAVQFSDQMTCSCGNVWDMNDPYPPECKKEPAMLAAAPAAQGEPVGWQFYQDGKWWHGDDRIKDHRKNTEEAGFRVRDVYAAPQPAVQKPDVTLLLGLLEHARCNTCDGSGGLYDNHGNPHQCQWCHDRSAALAAHRKGGDA